MVACPFSRITHPFILLRLPELKQPTVTLSFYLLHSPNLPDLARSDFFQFPKLKFHQRDPHFENNDEFLRAVEEFLKGQEASVFRDGIELLEHRWIKYTDVIGEYTEIYLKKTVSFLQILLCET